MYHIDTTAMIEAIKTHTPRRVLIQLPDGLKPQAQTIRNELAKHTNAHILFWAASNFGACDMPFHVEKLGVDLLIHVGHSPWKF